ncbi:MAG: lambda exonuclease family protein [Rhizomicrobium sp.]
MDQRTDAWFAARLGKATASRIADIIAKTKSGYSTSRANYAAQLVAERLTGTPADTFSNAAMQWGTEKEPEARIAYEFMHNTQVSEVGFIDHPRIAMSGASPDGLVGSDGLLELKCPNTATHIETLLGGSVPGKYLTQMQWQMACTGAAWCDFASYDPRLPDEMKLFVKRVDRDDNLIRDLEREVSTFLSEVDNTIAQLRARYAVEAA